ncbi:MAG: PmoA family protein [Planctomycetia bacterium]|nr:PmoA family protein [Planctomycetia bacterium]
MKKTGLSPLLVCLLSFLASCPVLAESPHSWSASAKDGQVIRICENGTFFADYRNNVDGTPILWPVCSRDGLLMTRAYPMINAVDPQTESGTMANIFANARAALPTEAMDHPHHRSIWFNHGNVNGADFWALEKQTRIETEVLSQKADESGVTITTQGRWFDEAKGTVTCTDYRTIRFGTTQCGDRTVRYIDFDVTVIASQGEVTFGDTKEGSFGIRVPGTMDVTATKRLNQEEKANGWGGKIRNSTGQEDEAAWGQQADWVDYSGPIPARLTDEQLANVPNGAADFPLTQGGIVVMNHPKSFRYPTWWHVRTYGLFAANPFGMKDFENDTPGADGTLRLASGESFSLGYRVLLYDGTLTREQINAAWTNYAHREGPERQAP